MVSCFACEVLCFMVSGHHWVCLSACVHLMKALILEVASRLWCVIWPLLVTGSHIRMAHVSCCWFHDRVCRIPRRGMHGLKRMCIQELTEAYGREKVEFKDEQRWNFLNTFFSVSEANLFLQVGHWVCFNLPSPACWHCSSSVLSIGRPHAVI